MNQGFENLEPTQPDDSPISNYQIQGYQNRAIQGDENQAVLGDHNTVVQGNNNLMITIKELVLGQQTKTSSNNPPRPNNERILLASVKEEVTARLKQSLHNELLINLGKESQPQQVKRPWDAEIKIGLKSAVPLPNTTTILQLFDSEEILGKLLILGNPGSGKTTTLLELAQALVSRAEQQADYPIPVLFNLSSWKDERQSLTNWLLTKLHSNYGIPTKIGQELLNKHQLLPMLDGLDELEPQRQEICVQSINQLLAGENRPLYLVVCSRIEEYNSYSSKLQLNGAIYLQPLTNNQIHDYLTNIKYTDLWSTISSDLDLLELVKTPLLLTITVLAAQEISVAEWQRLNSTAERLRYLLDAYLSRMLTRNINSSAYLHQKNPNARKTRMWLVWLAQQMQRESKTEFLIEEIQPSLLKSKSSKIIYNLIVWALVQMLLCGLISGLIFGLILGVYAGLISGLIGGLSGGIILGIINGLFTDLVESKIQETKFIDNNKFLQVSIIKGLVLGLISGLTLSLVGGRNVGLIGGIFSGIFSGMIGDKIQVVEALTFSYRNFRVGLILGLIGGIITGLILGFIYGTTDGLITGLGIGLIGGMIFGFHGLEIENKSISNQGIWQSAKNTLKLSILYFIPSTTLIFAIQRIIQKHSFDESLIFSLISGLFLGLLGGVPRGGTPLIKHFTLRLILYSKGYIPWNYARFLDYCTERLFLQRVGGRYRFIHKLLQDHFAQMEFKRDEVKQY